MIPKKSPNALIIYFIPSYKKGEFLPDLCVAPRDENKPFDIIFQGCTWSDEIINFTISPDEENVIEFLKDYIDKLYENLHQKVAKKQQK